jgi:amino acid transporter
MITMAAIVSLRNLSLTAELGSSAVFFLALAALVFFIPLSLVAAELAATWPRAGGCYVWVGEAFGKPLAFVSLWFSWMASVAWFPAILAFCATMFGHMLGFISPGIEQDPRFILITMLAIFWATTLNNFIGIKFSGMLSSIGVVVGTLIPGFLIIALGLWWILSNQPTQIPLTVDALVPDFKLDNLILFSGVILSFAGVELAAYHIRETKNPQKNYPHALGIAAVLILIVYIFGTLAIAAVVPQHDLLIASGLVQAFNVFFEQFGFLWIVPLLALFLLIGALAGINAWVVGPAKGMLVVAEDGFFPRWLRHTNKNGVPTALLLLQALVGSLLSMIFLYLQDNSASIWFLTALSAKFTCAQYALIFLAALKLRITKPQVPRAFKAPFMTLLASLGILSCLFGFVIVYVPHGKLVSINLGYYCLILLCGFFLLLAPALFLIKYRLRNK